MRHDTGLPSDSMKAGFLKPRRFAIWASSLVLLTAAATLTESAQAAPAHQKVCVYRVQLYFDYLVSQNEWVTVYSSQNADVAAAAFDWWYLAVVNGYARDLLFPGDDSACWWCPVEEPFWITKIRLIKDCEYVPIVSDSISRDLNP